MAHEVVGRDLREKSWGRLMLFVIGDSVEVSLSKWHLIERCNLCSTCSVPATIIARMYRFQYNAATEIDDNNSPGSMLFCLSLQILYVVLAIYFVSILCAGKEAKRARFLKVDGRMHLTYKNCNQSESLYVTQ
jgi:hypothetical protein